MYKLPLLAAVALSLSGCIQPDDLVSADAANARQELRLQGYQYLSCSQLRQQHAANLPARGPIGLISVTGGLGRQNLSDIEEMMRRKGCRLPEGVSS